MVFYEYLLEKSGAFELLFDFFQKLKHYVLQYHHREKRSERLHFRTGAGFASMMDFGEVRPWDTLHQLIEKLDENDAKLAVYVESEMKESPKSQSDLTQILTLLKDPIVILQRKFALTAMTQVIQALLFSQSEDLNTSPEFLKKLKSAGESLAALSKEIQILEDNPE